MNDKLNLKQSCLLHNNTQQLWWEKEDVHKRWFGRIEKSAHVGFFSRPFHRGVYGRPAAGSLLPESHLDMWGWPQGNPQWALGLAPRRSRTADRGLVTETHNWCSHDPTSVKELSTAMKSCKARVSNWKPNHARLFTTTLIIPSSDW